MPNARSKSFGRRRYRRRTAKKTGGSIKRYGRRRYGVKKIMSLRPKWINPLSQKQFAKFVYADTSFSRTLNAAGGYSAYYVFRGNSVFDPDYTGVGVQPYGYDQLCNADMYNFYRVASSSIKVYFRPEETYAGIRRLHVSVIPMRINNPIMTDISDVRMLPFQRSTAYDGATETTKGCIIKNYMSSGRLLTEASSKDFGYSAAYTGNPTGLWYWIVHFYTDVYDDEEVDIYFDVKIKYYTLLSRSGMPNES